MEKDITNSKIIAGWWEALSCIILRESPKSVLVDYDPDEYLESAAAIAGINLSNRLPIKTTTFVESLTVRVRYSGTIEKIATDSVGSVG
jgi:hypothetical protein